MIKFNYYITRINLQYVPKFMVASEHNDTCYDPATLLSSAIRAKWYVIHFTQVFIIY